MNYVLVRTNATELSTNKQFLADVWYSVEGAGCGQFVAKECLPVFVGFDNSFLEYGDTFNFDIKGEGKVLDYTESNSECITLKHKGDNYFIIKPFRINSVGFFSVNYLNKSVDITLCDKLVVCINGVKLIEKEVEGLSYQGFKIVKGHLVLNFEGIRTFVVIIKEEEVLCAEYYHEANEEGEDIYFLKRLNDSINHGRVFCIKSGKFDSYLVYLDNESMSLKEELLPLVFLDVIIAKNYGYACNLLDNELKPKNKEDLAEFFLEFDNFLPLPCKDFCLLKNGKPVGVAEFKTKNDKICSIVLN